MQRRMMAHAALALAVCALGLLAVHPESGLYPACPVHALFGVLCPGCGATRALAALLRGDGLAAWRANGLFVLALPLMAGYAGVAYRRAVCGERFEWPRVDRRVGYAGVVVAMVFALVRNG